MVNCFLEKQVEGAKSPIAVLRTPGLSHVLTFPTSPVRGAAAHDNKAYFVSGNKLYEVSKGVSTEIGSVPGTDRVQMFSNGPQLGIVSEGALYVYEEVLGEVTDAAYNESSDATYLDLFGVFVRPNSSDIFINNPGAASFPDLNDFDALDFRTAEAQSGNIVAIESDHRELFIFKESSAEIWTNTGNADFPFQPISNAFMELGCIARDSVAKADNTVFWLANDMTIRRADGYTPIRVSTHAIENEITKMAKREDALAFSHPHNGHLFYVITFPSENKTFVYDITTQLWHERETDGNEWRAGIYLYAEDTHYVGDLISGRIGQLDGEVYEDFGEVHRLSITSPSISKDGQQIFFSRLHVDFEMGRGLTTGQGEDPQVALQWSDDGGRTWSSEYWRSLGRIGEYSRRAVWHRLGASRDRVFRLTFSDPTPFTLIQAMADVEIGGT
jgi:hypothetical protein